MVAPCAGSSPQTIAGTYRPTRPRSGSGASTEHRSSKPACRVPDGDAVQRVWSVADGGGLTIIEIENESSRPFAVAFSGGGIVTERPTADVPIQGIDLPDDAIVLPVGHRSTLRVAIPHTSTSGTPERLVRAGAGHGGGERVGGGVRAGEPFVASRPLPGGSHRFGAL